MTEEKADAASRLTGIGGARRGIVGFWPFAEFISCCSATLYLYGIVRGAPVFPLSLVVPLLFSLLLLPVVTRIRLSPLVAIYSAYFLWPLLSFPAAVFAVRGAMGPGLLPYQLSSLAFFYLSAVPLILGYAFGKRGGKEMGPMVAGLRASLLLNSAFVLVVFCYYYPDIYVSRSVIQQRLPLIICYLSTLMVVLSAGRSRWSRLLAVFGLVMVALALSRASFLQLVISVAMLVLLFPLALFRAVWRLKGYLALILVALALAAVFYPKTFSVYRIVQERFSGLVSQKNLTSEDYSASTRLEVWRSLRTEIYAHPFSFALGFGQLGPSFIGKTFTASDGEVVTSYSAHNQYLDTFLRAGTPGLLLEGLLWAAVVYYSLRGRFRDRRQKLFARGNGVALLGVLAFGMFHETLRWSLFASFFWLFAGWLAGAVEADHAAREEGAR